MSVRSMTGFSKISADTDYGKITVEIRSVNRKYCEVQVKTPNILSFLEDEIRKKISSAVHRGKVDLSIYLDLDVKRKLVNLVPDFNYVQAYIDALNAIKEKFCIAGDIDISFFRGNSNILSGEQVNPDENIIKDSLFLIIDDCLAGLSIEKEKEGAVLKNDILARLSEISSEVNVIESLAPETVSKYKCRLLERIKEIKTDIALDDALIAKEVAFYADRVDVSEELVRLRSHFDNFISTINKGGAMGKTLDFIIQEMFRESNTIASKCVNSDISRITIRVRTELEKIREQVQNIE